MQFSFDEEQREFAGLVNDYLEQNFSARALRQQWEHGGHANSDLLSSLAELGIMAPAIPEEFEGLGRDGLDLPLAFEAFGYYGVAETIAFTSGVVAPFLVRYAAPETKRRWLPQIAQGRVLCTVQLEGDSLSIGASTADLFLIVRNGQVHLVAREQARVTDAVTQDPTLALGEVEAEVGAETLVSDAPGAVEYLQSLIRSAVSSILVGISQRLLDSAREYMLVREQFGRVIGSFQSLKHRMADTVVQIEAARSLSWYAHYSHVHDDAHHLTAANMAKSAASVAAHSANYTALQHHGGIGFTWEHDLHMWLQRGYALERMFGTADELRAALGAHYLERL